MKNIKSNKGITLLAISVLVVVMLMVTSAMIYRTKTMYKLKALNDMNNDLKMLEENISVYYSKYNSIPILDGNVLDKVDEIYSRDNVVTNRNTLDNDNYYVIDLTALENISLTNGKDFETFRNGDTTVSDIYVMNEKTHTVYYIAGILLDGDLYCTLEADYANMDNIPQIANPPLLTGGMIPIKHNGTGWVITTETDLDWYSYNTSNKKWANVMLSDGRYDSTAVSGTIVAESELGSMYVWIPRYAYKITNGVHSNGLTVGQAGTIEIRFLNGTTNQSRTQNIKVAKPDENNEINPYPSDYIQHPAFTFGEDELEGIWIAKFESSIYKTSNNENFSQTNIEIEDIDLKDYYIKSLPNKYTWRYTNISNMFAKAINMKSDPRYKLTQADTHMMKNTELGAVAYLSKSEFGINSEISINNNSSYLTEKGGSSTGNEFGVYDLNGGTKEYIAAYIDNGDIQLTTNGRTLIDAPAKYKDVYKKADTQNQTNNYEEAKYKVGDAIYETSKNGTNASPYAWFNDYSYFTQAGVPFITRTGLYSNTNYAGVFNFYADSGASNVSNGFRMAIINLNSRVQYGIEEADAGEPFTYIMAMPSDNLTYTIDLPTSYVYNFTVDWGDSTTSTVTSQTDTNKTHTYAVAGDYTVKISGRAEGAIKFQNEKRLKQLLTGYPKGMRVKQTSFNGWFSGCSGLTGNIPEGLFANTPNVISFDSTFMNCTGLTGSIPEKLFANCPKVSIFRQVFNGCSGLTGSIPEELFANTPNVSWFDSTFMNCSGLTGSIPEELFANTPNVTSFSQTFAYCSGLTGSIPEGLFTNCPKVTIFARTFSVCSGLTGSIPEGLFANCPKVTTFTSVFDQCWNLTGSIPENLFANCPNVTGFHRAFYTCSKLTGSIPEGLFANCPNVTDFEQVFYACNGLTGSIPAGLFANCINVTSFESTFENCKNLTGSIPAGLFANCINVTSFESTFNYCNALTGSIPENLFTNTPNVTSFYGTFNACWGLTGNIPTGLFSNTPNVTNFGITFSGCRGLTSIPENLFANTPNVINFSSTFWACQNLTGNAPDLWNRANVTTYVQCFTNCTKLSNYASIPAGWK